MPSNRAYRAPVCIAAKKSYRFLFDALRFKNNARKLFDVTSLHCGGNAVLTVNDKETFSAHPDDNRAACNPAPGAGNFKRLRVGFIPLI